MIQHPIARIEQSPDEKIHISLRESQGETFIDIRSHYTPPESAPLPTRKGVTLKPARFPSLKKPILTLGTALVQHCLLNRGAVPAAKREGEE